MEGVDGQIFEWCACPKSDFTETAFRLKKHSLSAFPCCKIRSARELDCPLIGFNDEHKMPFVA